MSRKLGLIKEALEDRCENDIITHIKLTHAFEVGVVRLDNHVDELQDRQLVLQHQRGDQLEMNVTQGSTAGRCNIVQNIAQR